MHFDEPESKVKQTLFIGIIILGGLAILFIVGFFVVPSDDATARLQLTVLKPTDPLFRIAPRWSILQRGARAMVAAGSALCQTPTDAMQSEGVVGYRGHCTSASGSEHVIIEYFVFVSKPNVPFFFGPQLELAGWDAPHYYVQVGLLNHHTFVGINQLHPAPQAGDLDVVLADTDVVIGGNRVTLRDDVVVHLQSRTRSIVSVEIVSNPLSGRVGTVPEDSLVYPLNQFIGVLFPVRNPTVSSIR